LTGGIPALVYLAIGNIAFPTLGLAFLVLVLLLRLKHGQSNLRILAWLRDLVFWGRLDISSPTSLQFQSRLAEHFCQATREY
jgi:hypothetical protein